MKQYDSILNTKDLHKSLYEHFSYLAAEDFAPVLRAIMQKATGVRVFEGNLIVSFTGDEELYASPAGGIKNYERWPKSFCEYVAKHEFLSFGTDHWELCLGNRKSFHFESRLLNNYDKKDILVPVINTFSFQMWLYHPTEKNSSGQNLIYHFAPNYGEDIDSPSELLAGQIFLKQMASALDIMY
ncbi:hypothetical protein KK062_18025 [Fulvivirgaceae bacterium PWU5]|uniref:Uncharacterized protein n=1 Tax=Dawidia cretensis TaxID=2782350 RepID=A0AAP2DYV0_9BACT|nr:hypothetical protein [Dawidia cretensis]MBT1710150.1 hypothetical protein [Dawidia cretensis]